MSKALTTLATQDRTCDMSAQQCIFHCRAYCMDATDLHNLASSYTCLQRVCEVDVWLFNHQLLFSKLANICCVQGSAKDNLVCAEEQDLGAAMVYTTDVDKLVGNKACWSAQHADVVC